MKVRLLCINDKDRPGEIPAGNWPKKGQPYTMTHLYYHNLQGVQGIELEEIRLGPESYPYETYKFERFAVSIEDLEKFKKMVEDCTDMNKVDLDKLVRELETVEI